MSTPPAGVVTVADLMTWLAGRGEEYAYAFENMKVIRAAIDRNHVQPGTQDRRRPRDRILSADDGGMRKGRRMTATIRLQREDFDAAARSRGADARAHRYRRGRHLHRHLPRPRRRPRRRGADARTLSRHGGGRDRPPCRRSAGALAAAGRHRHPSLRTHAARRQYRAGGHRLRAPAGGVRGGLVPDGLSEDPGAVLEAGRERRTARTGSRRKIPTTTPPHGG